MDDGSSCLAAPHLANLLAGKAVASASAYLEGRSDAAKLSAAADRLLLDLFIAPHHPASASLSDATRVLVIAMMRLAHAEEVWRVDRWHQLVAALVELVRDESNNLRRRP